MFFSEMGLHLFAAGSAWVHKHHTRTLLPNLLGTQLHVDSSSLFPVTSSDICHLNGPSRHKTPGGTIRQS